MEINYTSIKTILKIKWRKATIIDLYFRESEMENGSWKWKSENISRSVVSNSLWPHGL